MERSSDRAPVVTRRTVLAGSTALFGGATVFSGLASAQTQGTPTVGVIDAPDQWEPDDLEGFLLHVGAEVDPEPDTEVPECDFRDWPPDDVDPYNATVIDRKEGETPQEDVILYVATDAVVRSGFLFLVNKAEACESQYVGLELLQRGQNAGNRSVEIEDDERPNTPTGSPGEAVDTEFGPGFGGLGALAAALGLGGLLARRGESDN